MSALALVLVLQRVSLDSVGDWLVRASLGWVGAMLAVKLLLLFLKTERWKVVLSAMSPGRFRAVFRAVAIGYFGNLMLPFKLGELMRIGLLCRHNRRLGFGSTGTTVGTERLLDSGVLTLLVMAMLPTVQAPGWVRQGAWILSGAVIGGLALVIFGAFHRDIVRYLPGGKVGDLVSAAMGMVAAGTRVLRRPRPFVVALGWTVLVWLGEAFFLWLGGMALGLGFGYPEAVVVTMLYVFGAVIPSAPVQIGTHQALTVLFLAPFGVEEEAAFSLSLLLQAANVAVIGVLGGGVLFREAAAREIFREVQSEPPTTKISAESSGSSRPTSS